MTFSDIQTLVAARLNLTSSDALTRIGLEINDRYKRVTSSIGLAVTRRQTFQSTVTLGVNTLTFSGCEKIINVIDRSTSPYRVLQEITMEEMEAKEPAQNTFVTYYAIQTMGASSVTIRMDCVPQSTFTLYADGYGNASTLSGSQIPAFAESYHDILVHGVLADEYRKMMQKALALDEENQYNTRLGELRLFIRESANLEMFQGKTSGRALATGVPGAGGGASGFDGSQSWTQTGLVTFDRTGQPVSSRAPFAIQAGSEKVANLDADKLDGIDSTGFRQTGTAIVEADITLVDNTTNNVTSTKHGLAPKSPGDATKFLNGDVTPGYAQVKDSDLSTSDVATNNVTTAKHGFVPKAPNDTTKFLRGDASWASATTTFVPPRVTSVASSATPTPNADTDDLYDLTALAAAAVFAAPTGTPVNGQRLIVRIKDNGTARGLTWNAVYVAGGVTLPSTTVLSKILTIQFIYNTANALNKWQCVGVAQEQ